MDYFLYNHSPIYINLFKEEKRGTNRLLTDIDKKITYHHPFPHLQVYLLLITFVSCLNRFQKVAKTITDYLSKVTLL